MTGHTKRPAVAQAAIGLSLLNLIIVISGILWINNVFQRAEAHDQDIKETFKTRAGELSEALQSFGGIALLGAFVFALAWFFKLYKRVRRESALHRQSTELSSYLGNLSRDRGNNRKSSVGSLPPREGHRESASHR